MSQGPFTVTAEVETWPLREAFVIARGAKTEAKVVVARVRRGAFAGRGECVPYARYGETVDGVVADILAAAQCTSRQDLQQRLPAGAARNALDCALWDLEAKENRRSVAELIGLGAPKPLETCFTLSLGTPEAMADAAQRVPHFKLLKLKLGGEGDGERMRAVRAARPDARLVADANEAWSTDMLEPLLSEAASLGFALIEQPLPAGKDAALGNVRRAVPVCADESIHTRSDLGRLAGLYDAINVKLDKAGGLTEALALRDHARSAGLKIMVGCMVATSLAMAPAFLLGQDADWVDLDGPLLLARDRDQGFRITGGIVSPPDAALWG